MNSRVATPLPKRKCILVINLSGLNESILIIGQSVNLTLDTADLTRHAGKSLVNFVEESRELLVLLLHELAEHLRVLVILTLFVVEALLFHHPFQDVVLIQLECFH